jgi:dephospho-CoA kinase
LAGKLFMKVIGVIGLNGSGKDEVVKYLHSRYGVPLLSVGDIVRDIAAREGVRPTRTNLNQITKRYFDRYGEGYFLKLVVEKIRREGWESAGISGIRSPQDIRIIRDALGSDFILVHVYVTDPRVRYDRIRSRGSQRDRISYEEFLHQDQVSDEMFHIREAIRQADFSIPNDGSLEDLHREIENLVTEKNILNLKQQKEKS